MAPVYRRLGDRLGERNALLGAPAAFALGSLACGLTPSMRMLVGARLLQGLGGGLMQHAARPALRERPAGDLLAVSESLQGLFSKKKRLRGGSSKPLIH
jgi:MFS family permease